MMAKDTFLSQFHPLVARWFSGQFAGPTEVQVQSWRLIAAGQHVLITAPTGSGKTFAAFLWAINQLITGKYPTGDVSLEYLEQIEQEREQLKLKQKELSLKY